MKITEIGYIDIEDSDLSNLSILFGGRGLGKTFSVLKHRMENALSDENHKFIWLRDTETVVSKIAKKDFTKAVTSKSPELPEIATVKHDGNFCIMADPKTDNFRVLGYIMALSTFHNARGVSFEDVSNITWDEFIPEDGAIVKKDQGSIFLNAYESINRNRELEGMPPLQIIFLSNTNDIYSDVLEDLGVNQLIENMVYNNQKSFKDDDLWIEFLESKEFYEKKKETFIYRISNNYKFNQMALENKFNNNLALVKRNVDFKGSTGLFTVADRYTIIQLADGNLYWKNGVWKNLINYDMDNDQEAILFRLMFNDKLRLKYIAGQMFFDSIYTQRKILEYARI